MRKPAVGVIGACVLAMAVLWTAPPVEAAGPPADPRPLPRKIAELARKLGTADAIDDREADITIESEPGDRRNPSVALRDLITAVDGLAPRSGARAAAALRKARRAAAEAWDDFAAGADKLQHLSRTADDLRRVVAALDELDGPDTSAGGVRAQQLFAAGIAESLAATLLRRAEAGGVPASRLQRARDHLDHGHFNLTSGETEAAVVDFGHALKAAASTVTFDVALFQENIVDALAGQTVGHAFSIAYLGQLYQGGEASGLARTAADAPQTNHSPAKEQHVASISKTLTTIVLLRLMEEKGVTPEAFVSPYLPGNWILSAGAFNLRFRHFLTHTSGFGQVGAGSDYAGLQTAMSAVAGPSSFSYKNANFGLMRVLISGLLGIDPVDYGEFDAGGLTTAAFLIYAQQLFGSINVNIGCAPNDATPTLQYRFPDDGTNGYVEPDRQLLCGGYGWFISANELAAVLAHLHQTNQLLSKASWALMRNNYYGLMDPANYSFIGGDFGVYSMHGGDWYHSSREAHACVVVFPIKVEVGLVINSARGPAMPYQCALLQTAFDAAWVAK